MICSSGDDLGLPTGRAYVQLPDQTTAEKAQEQLDNKYLGIRKVRVSLSTPEEASKETDMYF